ncbi:hypothetical protein, partial [Candidatus Agathobaculum pullicola]|uniref:hypothetical protein n=1 Tax=Candidatus Agathobaculum pullicola TaxID=2838426 RepID=UPI003F8DB8ED
IHEYEALGGGSGRRLYCRLTSFSQNLQTFLRIILDSTRNFLNYTENAIKPINLLNCPYFCEIIIMIAGSHSTFFVQKRKYNWI